MFILYAGDILLTGNDVGISNNESLAFQEISLQDLGEASFIVETELIVDKPYTAKLVKFLL